MGNLLIGGLLAILSTAVTWWAYTAETRHPPHPVFIAVLLAGYTALYTFILNAAEAPTEPP